MKLGMICADDGSAHLAVVDDSRVIDITLAARGEPWARSVQALIETGPEGLARLEQVVAAVHAEGGPSPRLFRSLEATHFLAPLPRPPKNVFCLGRNYPEHIADGARAWGEPQERPEAPIIFTKPHTAITGPNSAIRHPANTQQLDYEGELAVVISKTGRSIPPERAYDYVFGYVLVNDVSARDIQRQGPQWFLGKGCDTFLPMGPWVLVPRFEGIPLEFEIRVFVNGQERQRFSTRHMIFGIPDIIAALSQNITLEPGDVIATGTGPGCGFALNPPAFLKVGDRVRVEADGLGVLENVVVAAEP